MKVYILVVLYWVAGVSGSCVAQDRLPLELTVHCPADPVYLGDVVAIKLSIRNYGKQTVSIDSLVLNKTITARIEHPLFDQSSSLFIPDEFEVNRRRRSPLVTILPNQSATKTLFVRFAFQDARTTLDAYYDDIHNLPTNDGPTHALPGTIEEALNTGTAAVASEQMLSYELNVGVDLQAHPTSASEIGVFRKSLSETIRLPVMSLVLRDKTIPGQEKLIDAIHNRRSGALLTIAFPLNNSDFEDVSKHLYGGTWLDSTLVHSSTYRYQVAEPKDRVNELIRLCLDIVANAEPQSRKWFAREIERDLASNRPDAIGRFRLGLEKLVAETE